MRCMSQGCEHDAKWQLGWRVVVRAMPDKPRKDIAVSGHLALGVCDDHRDANVQALLNSETKSVVDKKLLLTGLPPANWMTAQATCIPLVGDQFYLPMSRSQAKRPDLVRH